MVHSHEFPKIDHKIWDSYEEFASSPRMSAWPVPRARRGCRKIALTGQNPNRAIACRTIALARLRDMQSGPTPQKPRHDPLRNPHVRGTPCYRRVNYMIQLQSEG